ncbi:MAG: hypothetical protein AAGE80_04725 [Pseudomonadota bacterium]
MAIGARQSVNEPALHGTFALELAKDAIALHAKDNFSNWQEIGVAYPGSADFKRQIAWLKSQAGPSGEVMIWLQDDQITRHELQLTAKNRLDRRHEAALALTSSGAASGDFEFALGHAVGGAATPCLVLPGKTLHEAETYTRKWGFVPCGITLNTSQDGFAGSPVFEPPETRTSRLLRKWAIYGLLTGSLATTAGLSASILWAIALEGQRPGIERNEVPKISASLVSGRDTHPIEPARVEDESAALPIASGVLETVPNADSATLAMPDYGDTWAGRAPVPVSPAVLRHKPADARLTLGQPMTDLTAPVALASLGAPVAEPLTVDAVALHWSEEELAPVASTEALTGADTKNADTAQLGNPDTELAYLSPMPVPRPDRPQPSGGLALEPAVSDTAATTPRPGPQTAPNPMPRPKGAAARFAATRTLIPRTTRAPRTGLGSLVRAAKREGLPLDRTSLVGVINLQSGREALLRLPSGRFQRIAQGDVIEGWTVTLIGQDAVRLKRGGEQHTLVLVSR